MGHLQLMVTWYKIYHVGEQATHWDIQNKENSSLTGSEVALFWMWGPSAQTCSPVWRILYHVIVSSITLESVTIEVSYRSNGLTKMSIDLFISLKNSRM